MEEIAELKSKIKVVEVQIQAVEDQIAAKDRNEEELKEEVKVSSGRARVRNERDLDYVREEKKALREKEKALREKEKALRDEQARKESTSLDASDGHPPRKKAKISYSCVGFCEALYTWGRSNTEKKQLPQVEDDKAADPVTVGTDHPIALMRRKKVYVRQCYIQITNLLLPLLSSWTDWMQKANLASGPAEAPKGNDSFVLTGLPGLGKTVWMIYCIAKLFQSENIKSVFLQQRDANVTHEITRVGVITHEMKAENIPALRRPEAAWETVLFYDAMEPQFVGIKAPIILVTSPKSSITQKFLQRKPEVWNMPMWSKQELEEADALEPVGGATIQQVLDIYGPKARQCLPHTARTADEGELERSFDRKDVGNVIAAFSRGRVDVGDKGSHVVIGYTVDNAFQVTQIFFASKRIEDRCLEWLEDASWTGIGTILAAASATGSVGKSIATLALEAFCWAQITSGRSMDVRPLNALAEGAATADEFMADSMEKFDLLEHVEGDNEKLLQVPRAANLESVDALLATKTAFQVTCAYKHDIKAKGLVDAYKALDNQAFSSGNTLRLCFIVPRQKYKHFRTQDFQLGVGADGVSPVKQGPQTTLKRRVAQFVMAVDFIANP